MVNAFPEMLMTSVAHGVHDPFHICEPSQNCLIKTDSVRSLAITKGLGGFYQAVQTHHGISDFKQSTCLNVRLHKRGWKRPSVGARDC